MSRSESLPVALHGRRSRGDSDSDWTATPEPERVVIAVARSRAAGYWQPNQQPDCRTLTLALAALRQ